MTSPTAFTLEPGRWYAMTMYPGYLDEPYRSPVEVHRIEAVGDRMFELTFYNIGYLAGLQVMEKRFRTLHRHAGALITQVVDMPERTTIFEPLTAVWVSAFTPQFATMMIDALRRSTSRSQYRP